jgi:hypothetical protein
MPLWVNRATRRRHVSADCRGLAQARQWAVELERPDSIFEIPDGTPADVLAAVETFTVPCRLCVPGARELGGLVPFYFVDEGYEDEEEEDE